MTAAEPLLDAHQVAQLLGCTPSKVRALRRNPASGLAAIDISNGRGRPTWRWRPSTIQTFLRNRRQP